MPGLHHNYSLRLPPFTINLHPTRCMCSGISYSKVKWKWFIKNWLKMYDFVAKSSQNLWHGDITLWHMAPWFRSFSCIQIGDSESVRWRQEWSLSHWDNLYLKNVINVLCKWRRIKDIFEVTLFQLFPFVGEGRKEQYSHSMVHWPLMKCVFLFSYILQAKGRMYIYPTYGLYQYLLTILSVF